MRRRNVISSVVVIGLLAAACGGGDDGATTGEVPEESSDDDPGNAEGTEEASDEGEDDAAAAEIDGPDVTLTLGHPFPATHPIQVGAIEPFVEQVAEATNGTVTIEIVPGGALGPGDATYENTAAGAQDLGWALHGYTAGRFPLTNVIELPFMFDSAEQATEVLWTLYDEFPALQEEYADTELVGIWTHDTGDLWVSGDPVNTADDIVGRTLRAPGPQQNQLIEALGGAAVGMPAPELYDSLERGVIDGLMIAASGLSSFNLFEVLDAGVSCGCYVAAQFLVANPASWDQLSEAQRSAIEGVAGLEMSRLAAEVYDVEYQEVIDRLESEGIEYVELDDAERERWLEAGQEVVDAWIAEAEEAGAPGQEMYDRMAELAGS